MSAFVDVSRAIAWRNIRNSITRPVLTLVPMMIPLVFFATFAGGLSALGQAPGFNFAPGYTSFQFVFIWLQGSAFQGMFSGFLIARDFESGFARRLMLAAPNRAGIIGGYLASAIVRAAVGGVVLFGAGLAAGVRFEGNPLYTLALVLTGLTMTVITGLWAAGISLRFRTIQAGPLIQMPIFVALFLSPVFVPLALLNGWIKVAAQGNPLTVFMEQGRNFIAGTDAKVLLVVAVAAAAAFVLTVWAARGLRSAERAG